MKSLWGRPSIGFALTIVQKEVTWPQSGYGWSGNLNRLFSMTTTKDYRSENIDPAKEISRGADLTRRAIEALRGNFSPKRTMPIREIGSQQYPAQQPYDVTEERVKSQVQGRDAAYAEAKAEVEQMIAALNAEAADAVANAKADFEEKAKSYTAAVAKVEEQSEAFRETLTSAEIQKAEAIAKIKTEAADAVANAKADFEEKAKSYAAAVAKVEEQSEAFRETLTIAETQAAETIAKIKAEAADVVANAKAYFEEKAKSHTATIAEIEAQAKSAGNALAKARAEAEASTVEVQPEPVLIPVTSLPADTISCECCGKDNLQRDTLARIDSGQLLCPDCLRKLRGAIYN